MVPAFSLLVFDIENAPKPTRTVEPPKKKEKTPKPSADPVASASEAIERTRAASEIDGKMAGKKDKKVPNPKKMEATAAQAAGGKKATNKSTGTVNDATAPVPSMIDLRVGHIIDGTHFISLSCNEIDSCAVKKHPDADGLYIEVSCASFCRLLLIYFSSKSTLEKRLDLGQLSPALLTTYPSSKCETGGLLRLFVFLSHHLPNRWLISPIRSVI